VIAAHARRPRVRSLVCPLLACPWLACIGGLVLLLPVSCSPRASEPAFSRLLQIRPENRSGLYLNEKLVMHFSEALDPTSVHGLSVRIVAEEGTPARGALELRDESLTFVPEPVLARDLSDGGYRPATRYLVKLAGFPRVEALRGRSGRPLESSLEWSFETVDVREPPSGIVFEDPSLGRGLPAIVARTRIAPGEPIELEGGEPIDPSTVEGRDFELRAKQRAGAAGEPLMARLVENYDKRALHPRGTTRLLLWPERLLEPGTYYLVQHQTSSLRDFGRNPVRVFGPKAVPGPVEIEVVAADGSPSGSSYTEQFIDPSRRSIEAVPDTDGTAHWERTGRCSVRWPAAAGSGRDGAVALGEDEARRDLQATRLVLAQGAACRLHGETGTTVLRAQGAIRISGTLVREGSAGPVEAMPPLVPRAGEPRVDPPHESLSQWLGRAAESESDLTVLIAGGDLVVDGRIRTAGTLLLAAGGRIRVQHGDSLYAGRLVALGDGASSLSYLSPQGAGARNADVALLHLDEPLVNPLVAPLSFAVRSAPIPERGSAARWHPFPEVGAYPGAGRASVLYQGECQGDPLVEDPVQLGDCPTLRLLVRLEVRPDPGAPWDPPWVDYVELAWEPSGGRGSR
jgi:hypothetical protein